MATKNNFYVVWQGRKIGVFNSWPLCQESINGFSGALYKGFKTLEEANIAFGQGYYRFNNIEPPSEAPVEPQIHFGFPKAVNDTSEAPF
jgi:ribonuclease HI